MEEALLSEKEEWKRLGRWDLLVEELKKVSYIALPMVMVTVSQHLTRVFSMMMVGHLGELTLSGTAIATSLTNVTGFSLLVSNPILPYALCSLNKYFVVSLVLIFAVLFLC